MDELVTAFGIRVGHRLWRLGIKSIKELKIYISEHPIEEKKTNYWIWYGIGPKGYKQIINYLKD